MEMNPDAHDLNAAIASCQAAHKALEWARDSAAVESIYPTHLHLAVAELAQAIESVMKVLLRQ